MKKYWILSLFFCVACAAGNKIITTDDFSKIEVGITEKDLKKELGNPDVIRQCGSKEKEYEYIERIIAGDRNIESRHYFFIIRDEIVISKRMIQGDYYRPLLERNAYDLQTSYNNETEK